MHRRSFLKLGGAASLGWIGLSAPVSAAPLVSTDAAWRTFRLTYEVELPRDGLPAKLWLPLPETSEGGYQVALGSDSATTGSQGQHYVVSEYRAPAFYSEWQAEGTRTVKVSTLVRTRDRAVALEGYRPQRASLPPPVQKYLAPTQHIPTDGIVLATALGVVKGADTPLEKARAIYDWVVDNTFRDPKVQGCGRGDIRAMLETGNLGGKCADINSLFVGLARASGIPAREKTGIRVADSKYYKSMGKAGDVSKAQHCRAEFYLDGAGWVPVDPADVAKVVLEEKLGRDDARVAALRKQLFGGWEMNWVAFNHARDFVLRPAADSGPMNMFMYPHGEVAGVPRESLAPDHFRYRITSEEVISS